MSQKAPAAPAMPLIQVTSMPEVYFAYNLLFPLFHFTEYDLLVALLKI